MTTRKALCSYRKGIPVALSPRAWGVEFDVIDFASAKSPFEAFDRIAVVDIKGPLAQHKQWCEDSYDGIRERVQAAFASEAKTVVLRLNSPGGDFAGCIEVGKELRAMADASDKKLIAYTDSSALSAAYAIACVADEIVISPSAFVGSIGVWAPLIDETARDAAMGLQWVIVASGTRKADKNPHMGLTEEAVAGMQSQVDAMASLFFAHVSAARGLPVDAIAKLQGSEHFGANALTYHLADKVTNSWGEFLATLTGESPMAKSFGAARKAYQEALSKVAEGDDEDAKAAKKSLAKMAAEDEEEKAAAEGGEPDGDEKKEGASAEGEDKKEEASAGDDKPEEKAEGFEKEEKAAARSNLRVVAAATTAEVALAKRVHILEAERAAEKESVERNALFAKRPDFSKEIRATLASASLDIVRDAVKNWPRGTTKAEAVVTPKATRGDTQKDDENPSGASHKDGFVGLSEADYIASKMGATFAASGVTREGRNLTLGYMSPEQAQEAASKIKEV